MIPSREVRGLEPFVRLSDEDFASGLAAFAPTELPADETLLVEGEQDSSMLYVVGGRLRVTVGDPPVELGTIGVGELVGEMAMLGRDEPRAATVTTLEPSRLLVLEPRGLRWLRAQGHPLVSLLERMALGALCARLRDTDQRIGQAATGGGLPEPAAPGLLGRLVKALGGQLGGPPRPEPRADDGLRATRAFGRLDDPTLQALANRVELVGARTGTRLLEEGERGEDAWIVVSGEVAVYRSAIAGHEQLALLHAGTLFGHVSLIDGQARSATCVTTQPSWLIRVSRQVFRELALGADDSPGNFRLALTDALGSQLRLANGHLARLALADAAASVLASG